MEVGLIRKRVIGRSLVALIGAFVLAVVHQYLFYGNEPGISYPIFVLLLYIYLFHDIRDRLLEIPWFGWLLFTVIMLLSMTFVLYDNMVFFTLNMLVIPSLVFIHLAFVRGAKKFDWWDIRIVGDALNHLIPQSLRHVPTVIRILKVITARRFGNQQKSVISKVLIGLAIALPLLIVVVNLLASADGVFNRVMTSFPGWLNNLSIGNSFARFIWVVIFGVLFFGYFWGFVKPKRSRPDAGRAGLAAAQGGKGFKIDSIILATLLISVNVVYVLFVVVQFTYLFGAWDGALPDGKTYAEYARSGFVELVTVSVINFAILMVTLVYGGSGVEGGRLKRMNEILLYILVGCSGVMLYSAYMRLILYEEAYGYTYIRFLVHAFMIYLAILLIIAALRIRSGKIPIARCYIVISLVAYVLVNYAGMDRIIAEKNVDRFRDNGNIDALYLSTLSVDAIPVLIKFSEKEYPGMKPLLEEKWVSLANEDRKWPSFNGSRYRAETQLSRLFRNAEN